MTTDTACSSSLVALEQAFQSLNKNQCQSAIVGGANLCLKPATSLQFQKLGMLSPEGECRSFDESGRNQNNLRHFCYIFLNKTQIQQDLYGFVGNGYVRSEGVVVIHLQKRKVARRAYLTVLHAKTNSDGNKDQG